MSFSSKKENQIQRADDQPACDQAASQYILLDHQKTFSLRFTPWFWGNSHHMCMTRKKHVRSHQNQKVQIHIFMMKEIEIAIKTD